MIEISLTDFVDFVCKVGSSKQTKVKQIKGRDEYNPATDFYKALREGIVKFHKKSIEKKDLDEIANNLTDVKKINSYRENIKGYKKFLGRKDVKWFKPPSESWVAGELQIKVNPEVGLIFNSEEHVIKLYFKSDKLSKEKVNQILSLLEGQLRHLNKEAKFSILDVRNSRLYTNDQKSTQLLPLLEGEAKSFEVIWNKL